MLLLTLYAGYFWHVTDFHYDANLTGAGDGSKLLDLYIALIKVDMEAMEGVDLHDAGL